MNDNAGTHAYIHTYLTSISSSLVWQTFNCAIKRLVHETASQLCLYACSILTFSVMLFTFFLLPPSAATPDSAKQEADTNICPHLLQVQSYKGPTFCDHCGRIMIGIAKQGLKCEGRVMLHTASCKEHADLSYVGASPYQPDPTYLRHCCTTLSFVIAQCT